MPNRPRDPNQLGKMIVEIAIGEVEDPISAKKKRPSGRGVGGIKGGNARAARLTADERKKIASNAAKARWGRVSE
jgi:hypothetical protein